MAEIAERRQDEAFMQRLAERVVEDHVILQRLDGTGWTREPEPGREPDRPGDATTGRAWMDADGYHVWFAHDCVDGRSVVMLPYPKWRAEWRQVKPSVDCSACGLHAIYGIEYLLISGGSGGGSDEPTTR